MRQAVACLSAVVLLATAAPAAQAVPPALGVFEIRTKHPRFGSVCLDVEYGSLAHAALVLAWRCSGGTNQKWRLLAARASLPGYWHIRAVHSNKCLDVAHRSHAVGAAIVQGTCVGGDNQTWRIVDRGNDSYSFHPRHSNLCLQLPESNVDPNRIPTVEQGRCPGFTWQFRTTTP